MCCTVPQRAITRNVLTLELRWFGPGEISDRELRRFAEDSRVEARVDHYLVGTGDELGIKRRGAAGLLEHKQRLAQTPVSVARGARPLDGVAEQWRKNWPERAREGEWTLVDKRRALRRIGSCRAELTLLRHDLLATPHLTLAIETADVHALDQLTSGAATLLRSYPELATMLEHAESCGYPAWIRARWESNPRPSG